MMTPIDAVDEEQGVPTTARDLLHKDMLQPTQAREALRSSVWAWIRLSTYARHFGALECRPSTGRAVGSRDRQPAEYGE